MIKNWIINISLIAISSIIGLVLSEYLINKFIPIDKKRIIYDQTREVFQYNKEHIQYDSQTGFITKANFLVPFTNKEFKTTVKTNHLGFRDDEASCQDPDVLLLGDSFGFGWGVEKEESLESVLEKKSKLKILNMSVSGYNNVQEIALLDKWMQTHSIKNKTIILMYYVNDMIDNIDTSGINPIIDRTEDGIKISPVSIKHYNNWISGAIANLSATLVKNFYTMYYIRNLYYSLKNLCKTTSRQITNNECLTGSETRVFGMILEKLNKISVENNCKIIITYIPYSPYLKKPRYSKEYFFLKYLMSNYNFDLVDLNNRMIRNDYYLLDEHWNTKGHKKVAMILNEYLLKKYE